MMETPVAVKKVALGCLMITAGLLPMALSAQTSEGAAPAPAPAHAMPRPDELEPGVDTSKGEHGPSPAATSAVQSDAAAVHESQTDRRKGKAGTKPATAQAAPAVKAQDRMQLDASEITGNRELPKVMVIVPWKHADLGDLAGKPMNSLVDEVLQPIDRDVFQRQTRYYDALKPDAAPAGATAGPEQAAPRGR
jgi:hypothetical protein